MNLKISLKTYSLWFVLLVGTVSIPAIIVGMYLEPLTGDLTRIGYFSENDFGWNGKEFQYSPVLAKDGEVKTAYDIVVLGDSFSVHVDGAQTPKGSYWTNTLAKETGLKIGVFLLESDYAKQLLTGEYDFSFTPKIIIYQTVERELVNRLGAESQCPDTISHVLTNNTSFFKELSAKPIEFQRNKDFAITDLGYSIKFIISNFFFSLNSSVEKVKLNNNSLFSHKASEDLLFLSKDNIKQYWLKKNWKAIKCNALKMQNNVQKNGETLFVFMVAPDKSTIYAPFFKKAKKAGSNNGFALLESKGLNFFRLDELLLTQVKNGVKDVYLPNDTHWSSKTQALVGQKLLTYIKRLESRKEIE